MGRDRPDDRRRGCLEDRIRQRSGRAGQLLPRCRELAREIIDNCPPITVQAFKLALTELLYQDLDTAVRFTERAQRVVRSTKDHTEALTAYAEKRAPQWEGR